MQGKKAKQFTNSLYSFLVNFNQNILLFLYDWRQKKNNK